MIDLAGMTILITGGGSGIGREAARLFDRMGAELILVGRRLECLRETLPGARHVALDHGLDAEVAAFAQGCPALDGLFLNAGQLETGTVESSPVEQLDRMIAANLRGPWLMCHHLGPRLKEGASVVLTGSNIAIRSIPDSAAYAVAKAGVHMLAQVLAQEWGPRGIRCNAIAPGPVLTDMLKVRLENLEDPGGALDQLRHVNPLERLGTEAEVANLAAYLLSRESRWTTGTLIPVDGGATAVF
jgi:NAD(P)-dependent dehydrogenase (short-subunit alcohol dehydrogenase family)